MAVLNKINFFIILFSVFYAVQGYAQTSNEVSRSGKGLVILLHGLARSSASMSKMQKALEKENFKTCNIDYPSTRHRIAVLSSEYVLPKIRECIRDIDSPLNFVTHSLGGIIVRYLAKIELISNIGRVVMLSPPNRGSEVVNTLGETWLFNLINGPAGKELGTDINSMPLQLGPAGFEAGIITGNKSINLILSAMIDGEDDGKVSIENAKLEGMKDFIVLPLTHPFIMKDELCIKQTIHFLTFGEFIKDKT